MDTGTNRRVQQCGKIFCAVSQNNLDATRYLAFPMRCKTWDCPTCRKIKAEDYRARMGSINDGRKLWMYTLTYFHNVDAEYCWQQASHCWNRLRTHARKKYGHFDYIRVLESHTNSPYPHLHIIADVDLKPTWLGKAAVAAGFGYQIKCTPITSDGAFHYIKKYLTKEWQNEQAWYYRKKYRCRLISFSRGLLSPKQRGESWDRLIVGSDFAACLDHIFTDFTWSTQKKAELTYSDIREDYAEMTVIWTDREPTLAPPGDGGWAPEAAGHPFRPARDFWLTGDDAEVN